MKITEEDLVRFSKTKHKRRILRGDWSSDVSASLAKFVDPARLSSIGIQTTSLNLYKSIVEQFSLLYDNEPTIEMVDATPEQSAVLHDILSDIFLTSILAENNVNTIGLRESFIKIEWSARSNLPTLRIITPDTIVVKTDSDDPHFIVELRELRTRAIKNESEKFWDVWSIEDSSNPFFRIEDSNGVDVTASFVEVEDYPYIDSAGEPFLPFVMYRGAYTSQVWNYNTLDELVSATLELAVYWSMWGSIVKDSSYPQRWGLNVEIPGVSYRGEGSNKIGEISTSPSSILLFNGTGDASGTLGQFAPGGDPKELGEALRDYQRTILSNVGIHPADLQETSSSESGYAIQLKRSAQRREAKKLEPVFRYSDKELISKLISICISFGAHLLPIDPVIAISYNLSLDDQTDVKMELENDLRLLENNLISKVDLLMKHYPDLTEEQAMMKLAENTAINSGTLGAVVLDPKRVAEIAGLLQDKEEEETNTNEDGE